MVEFDEVLVDSDVGFRLSKFCSMVEDELGNVPTGKWSAQILIMLFGLFSLTKHNFLLC